MKAIALLTMTLLNIAFCSAADAQRASHSDDVGDQAVAIDDVISQVKQALAHVQSNPVMTQIPPLSEVKLSLQTVLGTKAGATFSFWVISFGGTWEKTKTQQLDLVLGPPPAQKEIGTASLTEALEAAIIAAATGIKNAGNGDIPLRMKSLDVQLSFTVKADGNATAKIVTPITYGFTGDLSKAAVQTLHLTFSAPKSPSP